MHKQKRKLIRIGETSLAVIIPKPWLEYNKLKYGDKLELISNSEIKIKMIKGE